MSETLLPLGEICEFKYGKSLPASTRDGGNFDVYGSNGVVGQHSETITSGPTIVVGRKGSIGELNFSNESCWPIDTTYYVDASSTSADLRWLYHALSGLHLTELNKSAAIPGLNRNDAYEKKLRVPSLAEQRRIAAILDKAEALRSKRREAIAKLDQLLQSVFLEMFGGDKDWSIQTMVIWLTFKVGYNFRAPDQKLKRFDPIYVLQMFIEISLSFLRSKTWVSQRVNFPELS